jgi:prepilin signal peptidase PulO-like enzyme (type II secretory pathway)
LSIELLFPCLLAGLYWWEVGAQGLIASQTLDTPVGPTALGVLVPGFQAPSAVLHVTFLAHVLLATLMLVASFIDIDEKTIPDEVTVTGTLIGLLLACLAPLAMLPEVKEQAGLSTTGAVIRVGQPPIPAIGANGGTLHVEPVTVVSPLDWPMLFEGAPNWRSLVIGLACFWLWGFALAPRIWRRSRGFVFAIKLIMLRVLRELGRPPLPFIMLAGTFVILAAWWWSGRAWVGLLSALTAMTASGGIIWAVRIIGSAALKREAMGFGDVTLMIMMGTLLGWQASLILFFLAPLAGIVIGMTQLFLRSDDVIPFGPFLCLAACVVVVCWAAIWNWAEPLFALGWLLPSVLVICLGLLGLMLAAWRQIKMLLFGRHESVTGL